MHTSLDQTFAALADPTRRAIVSRLARGDLSLGELAQPFDMSLPAVFKHVGVLADAGLVIREKQGRQLFCRLSAAPLKSAMEWLATYRQFWDERLDALGRYLQQETTRENNLWTPPPRSALPAPMPRRRKKSTQRGPIRKL